MTKKDLATGLALMIGVIAICAWASGGTFGQRCERAFPNDPLAQER